MHVFTVTFAAAVVGFFPRPASAVVTSAPPILQWFDSTYGTQETRVADFFQARTQALANEANMVKQKAKEEAERKRKLAAVGGSASKRGRKQRSAQDLALLNGDIISQEANFQVPSAAE